MTPTDTQIQLRLERRFDASPEHVFDAWTNPEVLQQWWAAGPNWDTPLAEVDLRPGGRYRLTMHDPDSGAQHTVGGEYTVVERPARLAYTWQWEAMAGDLGDISQVEVEFRPDGDGTQVVLIHSGLTSDDSRDRHEHGWNACLDNLAGRVFA